MTKQQFIVYYTKDNRPTTRRTKHTVVMDVLGNESYKRKLPWDTAACWGVVKGDKLRYVTLSRDTARSYRREHTGTVVALG
jgi:hypothetical protein